MTVQRCYLATTRVRRVFRWLWRGAGAALVLDLVFTIAFPRLDTPVSGWVAAQSGQDTLLGAMAFGFFCMLGFFLLCSGAVAILRLVLRQVALRRTDAMIGTVVSARQTGATVNNSPVMAIAVRVQGTGPAFVTTSRKLLDLGAIPRAGDRVRVDVSRAMPGLSRYRGPA